MKFQDLTLVSKVALGLALAGFVVSFSYTETTDLNGVVTCEFMDYGKIVLGGLAMMVGGLGELSAMRLGETRVANLVASGIASALGVVHLLVGFGILGGPC